MAKKNDVPMMSGTSRTPIASMIARPMPGQLKMVSMKTVPLSRTGRYSPSSVMMGMSAFRSACLKITARSGSPFARAVRT